MEGKALEYSLRNIASSSRFMEQVCSVWCQIRGVFPRSGLSSVPWRPHSSSGSTLTALMCAATAGAPRFLSFVWLHAPDKPISILHDWDRLIKEKNLLHVSMSTASVVLYFEVCRLRSETSIAHARGCMLMTSFPSQREPHQPGLFPLASPRDGISVMSQQIDIWAPPVSRSEFFFPFRLSSQLGIQPDLSPAHQGDEAQASSPLSESVSADSCMIQPMHLFYPGQSVALIHVLAGVPSGMAVLRLSICMVQVPLLQLHVAALAGAWLLPTADGDLWRRDLTRTFKMKKKKKKLNSDVFSLDFWKCSIVLRVLQVTGNVSCMFLIPAKLYSIGLRR